MASEIPREVQPHQRSRKGELKTMIYEVTPTRFGKNCPGPTKWNVSEDVEQPEFLYTFHGRVSLITLGGQRRIIE